MHLQSMRSQITVRFEAAIAHRAWVCTMFVVNFIVMIEISGRHKTFAACGANKRFFVCVLSGVYQ